MWVMTNFGAFSIVQHNEQPQVLVVRARVKAHLTALRDRHLPDLVIYHTPENDYHWRAFCLRNAVADFLSTATYELDYPNFKNSVKDDRLHDAYTSVWQVLFRAFGGYGRRPTRDTRYDLDALDEPEWLTDWRETERQLRERPARKAHGGKSGKRRRRSRKNDAKVA